MGLNTKKLSFESEHLNQLIRLAIEEDLAGGDFTSECFVPKKERSTARVMAKQDGVFSGAYLVAPLARELKIELQIKQSISDGESFKTGQELFSIEGKSCDLLKFERLFLNFIGHLSGVATLTKKYVDLVSDTKCKIHDTRKTLPGFRMLEKIAVSHGGGENHRMGLDDGIMIKENHIDAAGGLEKLLSLLGDKPTTKLFEIEVTNLDQLKMVLEYPFDVVMCDNFSNEDLKQAVEIRGNRKVLIEASGGITLDTLPQITQTGCDLVSIGALTHSAPNCDFSILTTRKS